MELTKIVALSVKKRCTFFITSNSLQAAIDAPNKNTGNGIEIITYASLSVRDVHASRLQQHVQVAGPELVKGKYVRVKFVGHRRVLSLTCNSTHNL